MTSSGSDRPAAAVGLVNLANGLTVLRLILVPVFVACLAAGGSAPHAAAWRIAAFGVFALASVTDLLDGELARRRGLTTEFGKIADPIADKALTGSALITLSALGDLSWWVTSIILLREVGVTALRFWVIRHGVMAASRGGKIKTVIQMVAIALYILPIEPGLARSVIMAVAVAITLLTGADYLARALRLRRAVGRGLPVRIVAPTAGPLGAPASGAGTAAKQDRGPDSEPGGSYGHGETVAPATPAVGASDPGSAE